MIDHDCSNAEDFVQKRNAILTGTQAKPVELSMGGATMDLEALNYIPVPVIILDRADEERFVYAWMNKAAQIFSGFGIDQIRGRNPRDVFPGRSGEQLAQRQETAGRTGKAMRYSYPMKLPRAEIWIETDLMPVRDDSGAVVRLIATMQDKTAEHALEVQRIHADAQVKEMEQEIGKYVSMAAKDLSSPMRQVGQIASKLREGFVDHGDGKLQMIEMLETVSVKAHELISDVLSSASSGGSRDNQSVIDLSQMAADIFTILDPQGIHALTAEPLLIETDPIALQFTLRSLTDNAIEHSGREKVSIQIGFDGEANGLLAFHVRDNGRGFENPALAFKDNSDVRSDAKHGLPSLKRMIGSRGGEIFAERPDDGPGALIRFSLAGKALPADAMIDEHRFYSNVSETGAMTD